VRKRFSAPVQTGLEAHSASWIMDTGSFSWEYVGRGVGLTIHLYLAPELKKE
jgi:hypothetical protein